MTRTAIALLLGLSLACTSVSALEIAGVDVPETLELTNTDSTLVLNGAGIRKKLFLKIYIGALYLPAKTADAREILGDTGPASVTMHFLHSEVSKDKIVKAWIRGLEKNTTPEDLAALQPQLDKFNRLFRTVRKGDVIRIDYIPGSGTEVRISGEWRGTVEGNTFFRSLLRVWLGVQPVTQSLKQAMLGGE